MSSSESRSSARMPMVSLCTAWQYNTPGASIHSPAFAGRTFLDFNLNSCLVRRPLFFPRGATSTFLSSGNYSSSLSFPFSVAIEYLSFTNRYVWELLEFSENWENRWLVVVFSIEISNDLFIKIYCCSRHGVCVV